MALQIIQMNPTKRKSKEKEFPIWRNQSQIARHFQVSPTQVKRWRELQSNPLPYNQKGSVIRIDLNVAEKWWRESNEAK